MIVTTSNPLQLSLAAMFIATAQVAFAAEKESASQDGSVPVTLTQSVDPA